jgi:hemolysin D
MQSSNIGRVKAIHVNDGDVGRAGQALIELDPTLAEADRQRLESDWVASTLELARWRAFSARMDTGKAGIADASAVETAGIGSAYKIGVPQSSVTLQRALLDQSIAEQRSKIAGIDQTLLRRRADAESTRHVPHRCRY